jgi:protein TonB
MSDSSWEGVLSNETVPRNSTVEVAATPKAMFRLRSRNTSRSSLILSLVLHGVGALVLSVIVVSQRQHLGAIFSAEMIEAPKAKPQIVKRRMAPRPPMEQRVTTVKELPVVAQSVPTTALPVVAFSAPVFSNDAASSMIRVVQTVAAPPPVIPARFADVKPTIAAPQMMTFPTVAISERFDVTPFQPTAGLTTFVSSVASDRRLADPLETLKNEVRKRVQQAQRYPRLAQANGVEGQTRVEFTLRRDGTLETVEVVKPSGSTALDDAAVAAVRDAAPFPPLPEDQRGDRIQFLLDVVFRLVAN